MGFGFSSAAGKCSGYRFKALCLGFWVQGLVIGFVVLALRFLCGSLGRNAWSIRQHAVLCNSDQEQTR